MIKIQLKKLEIKNFKGFKEFTLNLDGKNANVFGKNATGKTTLFDAFQWLLFDKNSLDSGVFSYKPIDKNGNEIHHLETSVKALLLINGEEVTLEKQSSEKWVTKRGTCESNYDGNVQTCLKNNIKIGTREFNKFITELIDVTVFKMITNPLNFNNLNWNDRRSVIMSFVEDITNEDVINSNIDELEILKAYSNKDINSFKIEQQRAVVTAKDELKKLPAKIEELNNLPKDEINVDELKKDLSEREKELNDLLIQKSSNSFDKQIFQLELEIDEINRRIASKERKLLEDYVERTKLISDNIYQIKRSIDSLNNQISDKKYAIDSNNRQINSDKNEIESITKRKQQLYSEYDSVNAQVFKDDKCPYCGQTLPVNDLDKKEKEFNTKKANNLDRIRNQGLNINSQIDQCNKNIACYIKNIEDLYNEIEQLNKEIVIKDTALKAEQEKYSSYLEGTDPTIAIDKVDIENIQKQIKAYKEIDHTEIDKKIYECRQAISDINMTIGKADSQVLIVKRLDELNVKLKEEANKKACAEKLVMACETFIRTKIALLESKINAGFKLVKWKMFNNNINGGLEETCIATVDGVPFNDLNNATKINAGLDIINVLQAKYDAIAPIFIDNAESINELEEMKESQLIALYVTEDKALRVDVKEEI